jgi:competence protein ComEA
MATCFFQGTRKAGATLGLLLLLAVPIAGAGPVNINTADAATLSRELRGIGAKRAQAIVDYRKAHGPFRSADELALVKGIGPAAINQNRADIRVDAQNSVQSPQGKSKCAPGTCGATVKSNTMDK